MFVCGGFYDSHKPVVEPLARLVLMLTDHIQNSNTVGDIIQGSIIFAMVRAR